MMIAMRVPADPFKPNFSLVSATVESDFSDSLREAHRLFVRNPSIGEHIFADQEAYGKQKKVTRLEDKAWVLNHQPSIFGDSEGQYIPQTKEIYLTDGRPRMTPFLVFVCIYIRGLFGGFKSKVTQRFLNESTTFRNMCFNLGVKAPGASTVIDNLNIVSAETYNIIHKAQILHALNEKLDTFDEASFDSTSVEGNVCWPTESNLLYLLVKRIYHVGSQLDKFGVSPMHERNFPKIIIDLNKINTKIALESGKPNCIKKRKSDYNAMLGKSKGAMAKFDKEMVKIIQSVEKVDILPSRKAKLLETISLMNEDILNLQKVINSAERRVIKGESVKAEDKVISISDRAARMIVKGGRDPVCGYKPQIGRSKNGFVSVLVVPLGNASDAGQLNGLIEKHRENTGVLPRVITVDDGYSNKKERDYWLEKGVETFSIGGAKGKKITAEDEWDSEEYCKARNDRSAVESIMYCLKFGYNLGRMMRRGLENVRNEMMEKIIAYNFDRTVLLTQRKLTA